MDFARLWFEYEPQVLRRNPATDIQRQRLWEVGRSVDSPHQHSRGSWGRGSVALCQAQWVRYLWLSRGVLSRCLGHQCVPQSSLDFQIPTLGLHHCSLSDPNLPVATHLWLQTCGSGLDLVFFFFSTCVCGAAGTRIDLRSIPAPQRVAFSWAIASGLLLCYSIYRFRKGSSRAEGCLGWV